MTNRKLLSELPSLCFFDAGLPCELHTDSNGLTLSSKRLISNDVVFVSSCLSRFSSSCYENDDDDPCAVYDFNGRQRTVCPCDAS